MKVSVKLPDHDKNHHQPPLLLRAKIPITILNLPFLSHFSTTPTHPSQVSLSLSTNFSSGPSLKLSYATTFAAANTSTIPPLALTLKSGAGVFGSPNNSPLIISANFSFNPSNPSNPNPTFSLHFKPQIGSFSLRKSSFSHSKPDVNSGSINGDSGLDSNSFAFVPLESPTAVKDIPIETSDTFSLFKGIQLAANTHMPVTKRSALNFRWLMDFPVNKIPILRINKIGFEMFEEKVRGDDENKKRLVSEGEVETLRSMCFWMKRELDDLTRMNKEMKCELADMKSVRMERNGGDFMNDGRKKGMPSVVNRPSGGFEQWKSKKNGGGNENGNMNKKKEENKNGNVAMDVENELQRAIAAATSS